MAVNLQPKHANFITRSVTAAQKFVDSYNAMVSLRAEWDALGYSTGIIDADFTGNNAYIASADLQAFYTSQGNLVTFWGSGNGTNISKLIP